MRWIGTKSYFCFGNSIPLFLQPFLDDLDLWLHRLKGRIHGREIGHTSAWIHWRNEIFLGFTAINGIHRSTERGEVRGGITVAGNDELLELNDAGVEGGDERIERMPNLLEIHRRRIPRSTPLLWPMGLVQVWNAPYDWREIWVIFQSTFTNVTLKNIKITISSYLRRCFWRTDGHDRASSSRPIFSIFQC